MAGLAPDALRIRPALLGDAVAIHAALQDMAKGLGKPAAMTASLTDLVRHGFGANPAFSGLVVEDGEQLAGFCLSFPIFSTWRAQPGVYVQDIYIAQAFRGSGVGESLLRELARRAAREGCLFLRLSVDAGNIAAQAFYRRLGLTHSDDEHAYGIDGAAFAALGHDLD